MPPQGGESSTASNWVGRRGSVRLVAMLDKPIGSRGNICYIFIFNIDTNHNQNQKIIIN